MRISSVSACWSRRRTSARRGSAVLALVWIIFIISVLPCVFTVGVPDTGVSWGVLSPLHPPFILQITFHLARHKPDTGSQLNEGNRPSCCLFPDPTQRRARCFIPKELQQCMCVDHLFITTLGCRMNL